MRKLFGYAGTHEEREKLFVRRATIGLVVGAIALGLTVGYLYSSKADRSSVDENRVGILTSCEHLNDLIVQSQRATPRTSGVLIAIILRTATPGDVAAYRAALAYDKAHPPLPASNCKQVIDAARKKEKR